VSDIDKHASLSLKERHHHNKEFLDPKHKLSWSLYSEFTLSFRQKNIIFGSLFITVSQTLATGLLWQQHFLYRHCSTVTFALVNCCLVPFSRHSILLQIEF
jgi:hypothetical protein